MAGHSFVAMETLNRVFAVTDIELFFYQGVRDGVIVAVHLYVIIEMDCGLFPVGQFIS